MRAPILVAATMLGLAGPASIAQTADPFLVATDPSLALVGPLRRATLVVADADGARRFFVEGMRMRLASEGVPTETEAGAWRRLWNLPPERRWRELRFDRPAVPEAAVIRVLAFEGEPAAAIRPRMDALLQGGLSLGFPVADQRALERRLARLGIRSTAGITAMTLPRGDGTTYRVEESHYRGPEGLYALGVWRERPLVPVGPIEARGGLGGPAYSGMVVVNADREVDFFRRVLGWEVRRDLRLRSDGPAGGLGLEAGTPYRFLQLFAPGTVTGYLVMLDFGAANRPNPVVPRMPNRGLVAWSFETRDLDAVLRRVAEFPDGRATLLSRPLVVAGSDGSARRIATLLSPNGLLLEIEERMP